MAKEHAGKVTIFAGDESDGLFISAVSRDPATVEIINNFSHMLGGAGEEFILGPAASETALAAPDVPLVFDDGFFDVDLIVAASENDGLPQLSSDEFEHMMPEFAETPVNLDRIFDSVQIGAAADTHDGALTDASLLPAADMAAFLPVSGVDVYDPGAALENLFKSLVTADES